MCAGYNCTEIVTFCSRLTSIDGADFLGWVYCPAWQPQTKKPAISWNKQSSNQPNKVYDFEWPQWT